jgi:hypothetical protein
VHPFDNQNVAQLGHCARMVQIAQVATTHHKPCGKPVIYNESVQSSSAGLKHGCRVAQTQWGSRRVLSLLWQERAAYLSSTITTAFTGFIFTRAWSRADIVEPESLPLR